MSEDVLKGKWTFEAYTFNATSFRNLGFRGTRRVAYSGRFRTLEGTSNELRTLRGSSNQVTVLRGSD